MENDHGAIVVGVDGSPGSMTALRWACRQARLTGSELLAVVAWEVPISYGYGYPSPLDDVDWSEDAQHTLDTAIAGLSPEELPVTIRTQVAHEHPGVALVSASRGADLLVVGSRGHGTAVEMLIGSVSQYCTHHATCPVVVVRPQAH